MTPEEYKAWQEQTKRSEGNWILDAVTLANHSEELFYKGGVNGQYVRIDQRGVMELGTYTGAIPHIGEAAFQRLAVKNYGTYAEAIKAAIERGGLDFLRAYAQPDW